MSEPTGDDIALLWRMVAIAASADWRGDDRLNFRFSAADLGHPATEVAAALRRLHEAPFTIGGTRVHDGIVQRFAAAEDGESFEVDLHPIARLLQLAYAPPRSRRH